MINKTEHLIRYFSLNLDKRATMRQISFETKIPYMTLNRVIKRLEQKNLILTERIGNSVVCSLNIKNPATKHYLTIASEYFKIHLIEKNQSIKNKPKEVKKWKSKK